MQEESVATLCYETATLVFKPTCERCRLRNLNMAYSHIHFDRYVSKTAICMHQKEMTGSRRRRPTSARHETNSGENNELKRYKLYGIVTYCVFYIALLSERRCGL